MGYFSNGTEGDMYQDRYCNRCKHDENGDCPVWLACLCHNSDQHDNTEVRQILNILIPRTADGLGNEQCKMFIESEKP